MSGQDLATETPQQDTTATHEAAPSFAPGPSLLGGVSGGAGGRLLHRKLSRRLARKGTDANGVAAGAEQAVAAADSSTGSPLPADLKGRFEGSLGADLSSVRVHTGSASAHAAESVSAKAYTVGTDIHFNQGQYDPGSQAGQHLLAHEVAHTVQQSSGAASGSQAKLEVSSPGDHHEAEADRAADRMVSGEGASVGSHGPVLSRETLTGNPQNLTNNAGNPTTTHAAPTINDAINHQQPAAAANQAGAKNVKVVRDETTPLQTGASVCVNPDAIYQEGGQQSPAPPGFTTVNGLHGTVDAPMVEHVADNAIFINGQPSPNDVQQMGIGDCYFLSLTMSIASRDPGKIKSMMAPDGSGGASVTFFHKKVTQPNAFLAFFGAGPTIEYEQITVQVSNELSYNLNPTAPLGSGQRAANGQPGGFQLHGAQLRCADAPANSKWWGKIAGDQLEIHRRDEFQCARWAPLLEKAYARFSERYGQYGGSQSGERTGGSGYADINGGWSQMAMFAFYGQQADMQGQNSANVQQQATTWAPGAQVLAQNPQVVNQLILLQGRGEAQQPGDTNSPVLTATSMVYLLIPRLQSAIPAAQSDADWANVTPASQTNIAAVLTAIQTYNATPATPKPAKDAARAAIGTACSTAVLPANAADLHSATRSKPIKDMLELAVDLKNIGTDQSPGQRNIYGDHVYSVVGVNFSTTTGVAVPLQALSASQRPLFFPLVDTTVSHVRLRNPHHTNEPDMQGNGTPRNAGDGAPSGASADGIFTMNLDEFFRNFTSVESGVFPRS